MKKEQMEKFSRRVYSAMLEQGLNKTQLAQKLGISQSYLWKKLNGDRGLDIDFCIKLAEVLNSTVDFFLGETDNPKSNVDKTNNIKEVKEHYKTEEHSLKEDKGNLILTLDNGRKMEIPATPEGYAVFREIAVAIANVSQTKI